MAPTGVKLIQSVQSKLPTSDSTKLARILAAVAVASVLLLTYALRVVERPIISDISTHREVLSTFIAIAASSSPQFRTSCSPYPSPF